MTLLELKIAFARLLSTLRFKEVDRDEAKLVFSNGSHLQLRVSQDRYYKDAFTLSLIDRRDGSEFAVWLLMRALGDPRAPSIDGQSNFLIETFPDFLADEPGWREAYRAVDQPEG